MLNMCICMKWFLILLFNSLFFFFFSLYFLMFDISYFMEFELFSLMSMMFEMVILLDWMSMMFVSFVLFISSFVIMYSKGYMGNDYNINRFIMLVLMFVFSMFLLIISPNLISILLGWDGLGLVSYCLVIYYQNIKSYNAGMLTVLSNRIGDVFLLLSISWMLNFGSWNFIYYLDLMNYDFNMLIVGSLVMLASITKSAQIPFSSWLPAAMAAPTPVSALVHSSTLVTAGVYLLIRFNLLFDNEFISFILLFLSSMTMFMSGLGANFEFDLKKIIALSTLSQLGLMMMILSIGYYKLAFFHLLTHAVFKALLFMCAGMFIHNMSHFQDIRFMGCLSLLMPISCSCFNVANLSLCGMPFLAGFYSKDLILEVFYFSYINLFLLVLCIFSTGLTVCYSFRLLYYSLISDFRFFSIILLDEDILMSKSMLGLMFLSIMSGSFLMWLIFPSCILVVLPFYLKILTLIICVLGGFFGYFISKFSLNFNKSLYFYHMSSFLGNMWFMPIISTYGIIKYPLVIGFYYNKLYECGWSEFFGA
nr:NADH dehydrogenase subunit 5 [Raymondia sp. A GC-2023a]